MRCLVDCFGRKSGLRSIEPLFRVMAGLVVHKPGHNVNLIESAWADGTAASRGAAEDGRSASDAANEIVRRPRAALPPGSSGEVGQRGQRRTTGGATPLPYAMRLFPPPTVLATGRTRP